MSEDVVERKKLHVVCSSVKHHGRRRGSESVNTTIALYRAKKFAAPMNYGAHLLNNPRAQGLKEQAWKHSNNGNLMRVFLLLLMMGGVMAVDDNSTMCFPPKSYWPKNFIPVPPKNFIPVPLRVYNPADFHGHISPVVIHSVANWTNPQPTHNKAWKFSEKILSHLGCHLSMLVFMTPLMSNLYRYKMAFPNQPGAVAVDGQAPNPMMDIRGGQSGLPFVGGVISSLFGIFYTVMVTHNKGVGVVNSVGGAVNLVYLILYFVRTTRERERFWVKVYLAVGCTAFFFLALIVLEFHPPNGKFACGVSFLVFTAMQHLMGFVVLRETVRTNAIGIIPVLASTVALITGIVWLLYGYAVNNRFVQISNWIWIFATVANLIMVWP